MTVSTAETTARPGTPIARARPIALARIAGPAPSKPIILAPGARSHAIAAPRRLPAEAEADYSPLVSLFERKSFRKQFQPDATILLHDEPAEAMYMVTSGIVRCCTIDSRSRRQIFSFATKGDFVGISYVDRWHFTAEAVDHVTLRALPRTTIEHALGVSDALRQDMHKRMRILLARREQQLLALLNNKAHERLFDFLKAFAATRSSAGHIALPMPRRDIADHLGLSVETVSRAFSDLKIKGLIDLASHEKYRILQWDEDQPRARAC
ncbi:Crp/Fnr family transcriptional regulator [Roseovarius sp. S1116L3]|uniref:Crp/Fnr family transcriptional regulator n=1 Tax=Roseovarius roseus TaxID=3342636 RepID=UPI003726EA10